MPKRISFWHMLAVCFVFGAVAPFAMYTSLTWAEDDEDDSVHDLMEKTHEGKNSPWRKAVLAANAEPIDWATIGLAIPRLQKMSSALTTAKSVEVRDAADGYVDSVKELAAKAKLRDAANTRIALKSLSQSCADCHYKGGPGGKLDD